MEMHGRLRRTRLLVWLCALVVLAIPAVASPDAVRAATPTTTTIEVPAGTVYGPVPITVHVRPAPQPLGGYIPAVTVLVDGGNALPMPLDSNGDASESRSIAPGVHQVQAIFEGIDDWAPSSSDPASVTVGVATTLTLASSLNPAEHTQPVTISATVVPVSGGVSGGTVTITDAFDGSTIASGPVGPGTPSVSVTRTFATGTHELTATYSGHEDLGPSEANLSQVIAADATVKVSGFKVQYTTFYPVKDGYRDTNAISATLAEPATVQVWVKTLADRTVRSVTLSRQPGAYSWAWNGRNNAGTLVAAAKYKIVQRVTDAAGNRVLSTKYTTVSLKKLVWSTHTITRNGEGYDGFWDPGNGWVSQGKSSYARGVRLSSGSSLAAVRYPFTLRSAVLYKPLAFKVLGRSPNGSGGLAGLWNRTSGGASDLRSYDVGTLGSGYRWYSFSMSSSAHRSGTRAYGVVLVYNDGAVMQFDVAQVRLVYGYAVLR